MDGSSPMSRLTKKDPARKYVWVNQLDPFARATYAMQGYVQETYTADGVCPLMVANPAKLLGQEILHPMGLALFSVDIAEAQRIDEEGLDGYGGQLQADATAARMRAGARHSDLRPVTGKDGQVYVDFRNGDESGERTETVGG